MTPQEFAALLARNPAALERALRPVVKKAAVNVKKSWRDGAQASSGGHAARYPFAIQFPDVVSSGGVVSADVYPDESAGGRQGNLAPILEFGTATNPPHGDGLAAANKERPQFEKWVQRAVRDAWRSAS